MSTGRKTKLTVQMPAKFEVDFARRVDRRTAFGSALIQRRDAWLSDLGGVENLSHSEQSLVDRGVWLGGMLEAHEQDVLNGQPLDAGAYTQLLNTLLGITRTLGPSRRQRPVRSLRDVMNGTAAP
jgi:hypothetical protein